MERTEPVGGPLLASVAFVPVVLFRDMRKDPQRKETGGPAPSRRPVLSSLLGRRLLGRTGFLLGRRFLGGRLLRGALLRGGCFLGGALLRGLLRCHGI